MYPESTLFRSEIEPDRFRGGEVSEALGRSRSDIVRDALPRQLSVLRFEEPREQVMPFAEARGYLTDEDVFEDVS
jgi:hypothetical protein